MPLRAAPNQLKPEKPKPQETEPETAGKPSPVPLSRRYLGMSAGIWWAPLPRNFNLYLRVIGATSNQRDIVQELMLRLPAKGGITKVIASDDDMSRSTGIPAVSVKDAVWPPGGGNSGSRKNAARNADNFRKWVTVVRGLPRAAGENHPQATEYDLARLFLDFAVWLAAGKPSKWPQKKKAPGKKKPEPTKKGPGKKQPIEK